MHELSIAHALVEQVSNIVRTKGGRRAVLVRVRLGVFSGVVREALETAFPFAAEGTPVEGASLEVEEVSVRIKCRTCDAISEPDFPLLVCKCCGSNDVELITGQELVLASVELEDE
ncbi:MAG: hydrogenase maturation nickel metallochaperone HypA/HybF [Kiritimatiellia bacterium]